VSAHPWALHLPAELFQTSSARCITSLDQSKEPNFGRCWSRPQGSIRLQEPAKPIFIFFNFYFSWGLSETQRGGGFLGPLHRWTFMKSLPVRLIRWDSACLDPVFADWACVILHFLSLLPSAYGHGLRRRCGLARLGKLSVAQKLSSPGPMLVYV
jgi:hypothetical protein